MKVFLLVDDNDVADAIIFLLRSELGFDVARVPLDDLASIMIRSTERGCIVIHASVPMIRRVMGKLGDVSHPIIILSTSHQHELLSQALGLESIRIPSDIENLPSRVRACLFR